MAERADMQRAAPIAARDVPGRARMRLAALLAAALIAFGCLTASAAGLAFADAEHSKVAPSTSMAKAKVLALEGMEPIGADKLKEGVYEIQAESTSPFFKIRGATLTVEEGRMSAAINIDSKSYPLVYLGTGEQAAAAPASDYIAFDNEAWTFTVPVAALDSEIDCAAYSKRRKQWYDRKIMFYAASLPEGALLVDVPEYGDPVEGERGHETVEASGPVPDEAADDAGAAPIDLPDGEYSIETNMTGGSGRASVSSPTWLIVEDGHAYARLLWSSPYYDYMVVDDERYENQTDDGSNSTFVIPITAFDAEIPVIADTTAMGDPVEIEYHLTFYADTVADKDAIPQEAAIKVLYIALAVIVVGGVLNHILKRRRRR